MSSSDSTASNDSNEQAQETSNILFEASTQTPTNEQCDSPLFTHKGYCLKTTGHSTHALTNIYKMKQHGQVSWFVLNPVYLLLSNFEVHKRTINF